MITRKIIRVELQNDISWSEFAQVLSSLGFAVANCPIKLSFQGASRLSVNESPKNAMRLSPVGLGITVSALGTR